MGTVHTLLGNCFTVKEAFYHVVGLARARSDAHPVVMQGCRSDAVAPSALLLYEAQRSVCFLQPGKMCGTCHVLLMSAVIRGPSAGRRSTAR